MAQLHRRNASCWHIRPAFKPITRDPFRCYRQRAAERCFHQRGNPIIIGLPTGQSRSVASAVDCNG